jgi:integrase
VFVLHRPRKLSYGGLASSLGRHLRTNLLLTSAFLSVPRIGSTRGTGRQEWFVFAFGTPLPNDPTRPITSFKTAWTKVRQKAGVKGRWHDNRHTLVTELAESGAGDEVIMSIAGRVSSAMLSRYSHVRMEPKRRALDEIAARQSAAGENRQKDAEDRAQAPKLPLEAVQ